MIHVDATVSMRKEIGVEIEIEDEHWKWDQVECLDELDLSFRFQIQFKGVGWWSWFFNFKSAWVEVILAWSYKICFWRVDQVLNKFE